MKILFCSSGPYSGSGYGTQVYHLMKYFTNNGHKVGLIATDFGNYIKFRSEPYTFDELVQRGCFNIEKKIDLPDYPIYPINKNDYGWDVIRTHYQHFQADVCIFFRDPWKILEIQDCVEIPHTMFTWIPIDHDPVSDTLIKCVRIIPNLVSMSDFGQKQLMNHGLKNSMIPHCITTDLRVEDARKNGRLQDLKLETRKKYPAVFSSQNYPVILVALTNNQFPSRKAIDQNLKGLREFVRRYPDCKVIIHGNMSGHQNGHKEGIDMNFICQYLDYPPNTIWVPYNDRIVERSKVIDLYLMADILLHCSAGEGFGVPIIEAQYYGCSVVTNNCTAMPELTYNGICVSDNYKIYVNNVNSFWYYPKPEAITQALLQLTKRTEVLNRVMMYNGSSFIYNNFNVDTIGKMWLEALQKVANPNPKYTQIKAFVTPLK